MSSATGVTETAARRPLRWAAAEIVASTAESPSAVTLTLAVPGWPGHRAGQHLDVRLTADDGYRAERSYSIASAPAEPAVRITIERIDDGEVSPWLAGEARPGDVLEVRGPIGGWFTWAPADGGPLLLLAGGSGLVPLMAMLRHRRERASAVPARLLLSARRVEDILYRAELDELAAQPGGPEVAITLTRTPPPDWRGRIGRVTAEMLERTDWPAAERPRAYVCGPTGFVEAVADALVGLGHDPADVRTERFGPTGG